MAVDEQQGELRDAAGSEVESRWWWQPRLSLPVASVILLALTHVWPWWLPAIRTDRDIWIGLAVGQLSFWPLFAGLVGVRLRWPATCMLAGVAGGFGMLCYCRWQFGFHGFRSEPTRDIVPLAVLGAIGVLVVLIVYFVCVRALRKAERANPTPPVLRVAKSGALAGLVISSAAAVLLGIPWLCLESKWEIVNRGPAVALVAVCGIVGLAAASALWGILIALARHRHRFSWRRAVVFAVAMTGVAVGTTAWFLSPLVRHHFACKSLTAAGVEVVTWEQLFNWDHLGLHEGDPFWRRWHDALVPDVTAIRIDAKKVSADGLASLGDLRDDHLQVQIENPDPENLILHELSKVRGVRYLDISFPVPDAESFPMPGDLNDEAFSHIANIAGLRSLKLFHVGFTADGLERLVGNVDLECLHFQFCPVDDEMLNIVREFKHLQSLALTQTTVTDEGLRSLRGLTELEVLWLDFNLLRGEGLRHIAALPLLGRLILEGSAIRDDGLRHLARLQYLRELDLRRTQITGRGLRYLVRAPALEQVDVDGAALDDAGLMSAASLPWKVKLNLGATPTLTLPGIILMHGERARLRALPTGFGSADENRVDAFAVDAAALPDEIVEPYEAWLRDESSGDASDEDDEVMVDAEMEFEHNTIILYQYGVSDERIEAYRWEVFGEPSEDEPSQNERSQR